MVFCGESIITEISVYVFFYMSEFIIQSTVNFSKEAESRDKYVEAFRNRAFIKTF